jgi:hypothetical protein
MHIMCMGRVYSMWRALRRSRTRQSWFVAGPGCLLCRRRPLPRLLQDILTRLTYASRRYSGAHGGVVGRNGVDAMGVACREVPVPWKFYVSELAAY